MMKHHSMQEACLGELLSCNQRLEVPMHLQYPVAVLSAAVALHEASIPAEKAAQPLSVCTTKAPHWLKGAQLVPCYFSRSAKEQISSTSGTAGFGMLVDAGGKSWKAHLSTHSLPGAMPKNFSFLPGPLGCRSGSAS